MKINTIILIYILFSITSLQAQIAINSDDSNAASGTILHVKGDAASKHIVLLPGTNGYVGMGMVAPTQHLDVLGTLKATHFVGDGSTITGTTGTDDQNISNVGLTGTTLTIDIEDGASQTVNLPNLDDNLGNHTATQKIDLSSFKLVGNGGSTGISIANNGNVGIGTTSAAGAKLEVAGQIKITGAGPGTGKVLKCDNYGLASWQTSTVTSTTQYLSTSGNSITISNNGNTISTSVQALDVTGNNLSIGYGNSVTLPSTDDNLGDHTASQNIILGDNTIRRSSGSYPYIYLSSTEPSFYATGSSAGAFYSDQSSAYIKLSANGAVGTYLTYYQPTDISGFGGVSATTSTNNILIDYWGHVGMGYMPDANYALKLAGDLGINGSVITLSDRNAKENIHNVQDVLVKLNNINAYTYYLKTDTSAQKQLHHGFMSQEIARVFPELTNEFEHGGIEYIGVKYMEMIPILLQTIKEQQEQLALQDEQLDAFLAVGY